MSIRSSLQVYMSLALLNLYLLLIKVTERSTLSLLYYNYWLSFSPCRCAKFFFIYFFSYVLRHPYGVQTHLILPFDELNYLSLWSIIFFLLPVMLFALKSDTIFFLVTEWMAYLFYNSTFILSILKF